MKIFNRELAEFKEPRERELMIDEETDEPDFEEPDYVLDEYKDDMPWDMMIVMRNALKRSPGVLDGNAINIGRISYEFLKEELENSGWEYVGNQENKRKPYGHHGEEEEHFSVLAEYNGEKTNDLEHVFKNTNYRGKIILADFLSGAYTELMIQELYQAGWVYKGKHLKYRYPWDDDILTQSLVDPK